MTAKPEGGSGSYTYAWYAGDEGDVIAISQEITVYPTTTTTYKVVVTDTIENKEATATVTVIQASHTITADPAVLDFGSVNLDDKDSYTQPATQTVKVKNTGNSAVTLKAEYLETLKEGKHTISIVSENGVADAAFTIVKGADKPVPDKPTPSNSGKDTKTPQTGDNSNIALWFILLALCGGTIAVISIRKKRI